MYVWMCIGYLEISVTDSGVNRSRDPLNVHISSLTHHIHAPMHSIERYEGLTHTHPYDRF